MVGVDKFGKTAPPPYTFRPPRHVPLFMKFGELVAPVYMRRMLKVNRIEIDDSVKDNVHKFQGMRVVLNPNHPTQDPAVLFLVSRRLGMSFYWMAARELLEHPLQGRVVSKLGVYSIDRGRRDPESLNTTVRLLMEGKNWVVIFPEGINHLLHDEVMPFLPGSAKLGLRALKELKEKHGQFPPVYLVPIALRYYYLRDMTRAAIESLERLEKRLGLKGRQGELWQNRMARISEMVLELNEKHYQVIPQPNATPDERLEQLKETALRRIAEGMGTELPSGALTLRNRIRKILNMSSTLLNDEGLPGGEYAKELSRIQRDRVLYLRKELSRLAVFMPLKWDYDIAVPTVENFLDVLNILEMDLLGTQRAWGPRGVRIKAGEPIDLRDHYEAFIQNPIQTSEMLMMQQETAVRGLLESMKDLMTPVPKHLIM